jgi:hypothetical protein
MITGIGTRAMGGGFQQHGRYIFLFMHYKEILHTTFKPATTRSLNAASVEHI